jgi:ribosomal protein S28E/S33
MAMLRSFTRVLLPTLLAAAEITNSMGHVLLQLHQRHLNVEQAGESLKSGDTIFLRAHTGRFITVEGQSIHAKWDNRLSWEAFVVERYAGAGPVHSGDALFLRAHTGNRVAVEGETVHAQWDNQGSWEQLVIEKKNFSGPVHYGDVIFLKAHTGKRITVENDAVHAKWDHRGAWQELTIEGPETTPAPTPTPTPLPSPSPSTSRKGTLTMWATKEALIGAQCEYGNAPVSGLTDGVLNSYLTSGFHCAIGDSEPGFGKGENCGKCYRITSLSDSGTSGTPGQKGSAVVMVSDGGAGGASHFDCILEGFRGITGAETGIFDVEFEETTCEDITGNPVVINWADQNAWYCKMMFHNVGDWGSLKSVRACLDNNPNNCKELELFSGATWTGCPQGTGSSMLFELTQESPSGTESTISCDCLGSWPWPTGQRCECQDNFA